jgi:23S rRNA pseudouridine955/2504/2580 synthase
VRYVTVGTEHEGRRIDNYLGTLLSGVPRGRLYRMLRRGEVRVNGGRVGPDYRVQSNDRIRLPPAFERRRTTAADPGLAARLPDLVVFENADVLVIDKPSGVAVHGGSGVHAGLIGTLRAMRAGTGYLELAHRLDRETSGCLVIAKSMPTLKRLHHLFRTGAITKRYLALVGGRWPAGWTRVEAGLSRRRRGGKRLVEVNPAGKAALSRFRALDYLPGATLVEVELASGRTHQIRVHAAAAGHPLAGDQRYGDRDLNRRLRGLGLRRLFLHATLLRIPAGDGNDELIVNTPLPAELSDVLDRLAGAGS